MILTKNKYLTIRQRFLVDGRRCQRHLLPSRFSIPPNQFSFFITIKLTVASSIKNFLFNAYLSRSGLQVLPNNAKMHYNYANFLRDTSNFNLAKHHYRKALRLWPNYPSAWNNLGTILDDDVDAQEQHFLAAIKLSDQHLNAHFNLGQLYR